MSFNFVPRGTRTELVKTCKTKMWDWRELLKIRRRTKKDTNFGHQDESFVKFS